jgi:hypothetical protein
MAWRSETDRRIIPQPRETLNEGNVSFIQVERWLIERVDGAWIYALDQFPLFRAYNQMTALLQ